MALILPIFLLIFFGLIDFGRMAFHFVMAEKSMQIAARTAAVRPPACAGVPTINHRGTVQPNEPAPSYGTSCRSGSGVCADPGTVACSGSGNDTATEIWSMISPAMPNHATIENLNFSYSFDSNLGFLGGPYVPVVTVELQELTFSFATPLGALAGLAGSTGDQTFDADITFPSMSVSLPGEYLGSGVGG